MVDMCESLLRVTSLEDVQDVFSQDNLGVVNHLQELGLLRKRDNCSRCRRMLRLHKNYQFSLGYCFRCASCSRIESLMIGTFFENVHMPIRLIIILLWFWCCQVSSRTVNRIYNIRRASVLQFYRFFNDTCSWKLLKSEEYFMFGGPGVVVQITDLISKRKHNKCKPLLVPERWALGIFDTEKRRGAIFFVSNRSSKTLCELIERHVLPGTVIWTTCWKGYVALRHWKCVSPYVHCTSNKRKNLFDPKTKTYTNNVLVYWSKLIRFCRRQEVLRSKLFLKHVDRFMWMDIYGSSHIEAFQALLRNMAERYSVT